VLAVVVVVAVVVVAVWDRSGTAARLRRRFGLTRSEVASEASMAAGLQRRLPLGTDRRGVERFLRESLDGDVSSMVEFSDRGTGQRGYLCTFGYDVSEIGFVKETYHIWFGLDPGDELKGISVTRSLTGL
jgi:hypothetical protein